jgi:hypothetical protein
MARASQAVRDIDWLMERGLTEMLFQRYVHHQGKSMRGFRSYCESNPGREFQGANAGNCDRLRYAVKHFRDGELEEVLQDGLREHPK